MGKKTKNGPKCLVELYGQSLLDWQISALSAAGINDIFVVCGYKGELLNNTTYRVIKNPRWRESNMVTSLLCAKDAIKKNNCIVSYSDILYHPEIIRTLKLASHDIAITYDLLWESLWRMRFHDPLEDAETFQISEGYLISIGKRPKNIDEIQGQYMGLIKLTSRGWHRITDVLEGLSQDQIDELDVTTLLNYLLHKRIPIGVVPVNGKWCECDNETDLALYQKKIEQIESQGRNWAHDWREY
jgi:choline kinase